jgi:D-alanine-D-alanine ligase
MHSLVHDYDMLQASCKRQLAASKQAVLVEEYLPGREFTVGLVGSGSRIQVVGVMEVLFRNNDAAGIYSYEHKAHYEQYIQYAIPERHLYEQCSDLSIRAWRGLACRDGGRIDLRQDKHGVINFMEVNPLPGLNPIHSDLPILSKMAGISYHELIGMIMQEAVFRVDRSLHTNHA